MIRLESYGDSLQKDDYECHSRFRQVTNFSNGRAMVALVDKNVGPGPHHLVISGLGPEKVERLRISAKGISLNDRRMVFVKARRYDSRIDLHGEIVTGRFAANLDHFSHCLLARAPSQSMVFLLDPARRQHWRSALERALAARLARGSALIFSPDLLAGIKMCKGLGFGLTPGGDDFIGGILLALHTGQRIFKNDFSPAIKALCKQAKGKNPFSNMLLVHASEGRAIGKIKDLLTELIYGEGKNICRYTSQLLTIGHSSGTDFGYGLLLTFQKLIRNKGEQWW
jgi:hypothetical protein